MSAHKIMVRDYQVKNPNGIHGRQASKLLKTATAFGCTLFISAEALRVAVAHIPPKMQILGPILEEDPQWYFAAIGNLMHLNVQKGSSVKLGVRGRDAAICLHAFGYLFALYFHKIDREN